MEGKAMASGFWEEEAGWGNKIMKTKGKKRTPNLYLNEKVQFSLNGSFNEIFVFLHLVRRYIIAVHYLTLSKRAGK